MIYHVGLQKLGANWDAPGHQYRGTVDHLPEVGRRYMVILEGDQKYINLSEVKSLGPIHEDGRLVKIIIKTLNSTYILTISHTEESP